MMSHHMLRARPTIGDLGIADGIKLGWGLPNHPLQIDPPCGYAKIDSSRADRRLARQPHSLSVPTHALIRTLYFTFLGHFRPLTFGGLPLSGTVSLPEFLRFPLI